MGNNPTAAPRWSDGWLNTAKRHPSPNYGPRPASAAVDLVVLHSISLPPGEYGGNAIRDLFSNTLDWDAHPYFQSIRGMQVSSHFLILRTGTLWQFVSCDERAWHAGQSFYRGRSNCNDDSIGIELEGMDDDQFTEAQYATLQLLCEAIGSQYAIHFVAGHQHIAPGRKTDPGPGLDWQRLQRWVALSKWQFPE